MIRRIDVAVKDVWWSDSGDLVAIASDSSFYILRYDPEATAAAFAAGEVDEGEGVEDAFELLTRGGRTSKDRGVGGGIVSFYNNADWRLNYCVGGEVTTIFHLDRPMYLLGYLAAQKPSVPHRQAVRGGVLHPATLTDRVQNPGFEGRDGRGGNVNGHDSEGPVQPRGEVPGGEGASRGGA